MLLHEIYRLESTKNPSGHALQYQNYLILRTWIEENMGISAMEKFTEMDRSRGNKRDKRYEA
jgi:hypothetical protein